MLKNFVRDSLTIRAVIRNNSKSIEQCNVSVARETDAFEEVCISGSACE